MDSLYRQLADTQIVHSHLDKLEFVDSEKEQILEIVDHIFHHRLLAVVLEGLEGNEKITFIELVDSGNHIMVVDYIKTKVVNIEDKLKVLVEEVHQQVIEDILSASER